MRAILISMFLAVSPSAWAIVAQGQKWMYAGPSPWAGEAAREIFAAGGNVADAAVAVAASLAVTHPYYASFGGGGFAMVRWGQQVQALDFREVAPAAADAAMFTKAEKGASITGGLAIGVPGITAGLFELHQRWGHLKWRRCLEPAQRLAKNGFRVSGEWADITKSDWARMQGAGHKYFGRDDKPLRPGDLLRQKNLGEFLRLLAGKGAKSFYEGAVAKDVVAAAHARGGVLQEEDLKNYKPVWREPVQMRFYEYRLFSMAPPSSGGVVMAQALSLIEHLKVKEMPALSVRELHHLAEIFKQAYRSRSQLGDPGFAPFNWAELLLSGAVEKLATAIRPDHAAPVTGIAAQPEGQQTTHFSLMDAGGNAIAMTLTLNGSYGSGVVSEKFGIALNNEMDDFTTRPGEPNMYGLVQGEANNIVPGKRPLSSMSPTIAVRDDQTALVLGAPGGPRIISAVTQVAYRVLARAQDLDLAVQTPRVHHQFLPNKVFLDEARLSPEVLEGLRKLGHAVEGGSTGRVYAVRRRADGILEGAYDSRGEGAAGGE